MPESFLIRVTAELGIDLPPRKYYGVGMVFLPTDETLRSQVKATMMDVRPYSLPYFSHCNLSFLSSVKGRLCPCCARGA